MGVFGNVGVGAKVKGTSLRHLGYSTLLLPCLLPWLHPDPPACSHLTLKVPACALLAPVLTS